ncbi:hypothetical protein BV881_31805 [Streptomyces sp. ZL-24]|uniref:hypothetical protein n=1 Tax=Streptomyces sp. ZL-24 TaxID=1933029 RepID=UPI000CD43720|nr:hypothetical protein [Streptomyces sp. ZL-24]POG43436.1 hypothetical protein BV881_31805 [Streptomyces sp. ZL-24]
MYSLTPGFRIPALQRGLSTTETALTKLNGLAASGLVLSGLAATTPPLGALGTVGAAALVLNVAPGPRSIARWAAVGYRRVRERTAPESMTHQPGETRTWTLYPQHGTMQDPHRRADWHTALSGALAYAGNQVRGGGVQIHVTHHATVHDTTTHLQTISVHIPRGLAPARVMDTLEHELAMLGDLIPYTPDPPPAVAERGRGWVALEDGRYASTARITGWPGETSGDLMPLLLLNQNQDRSLATCYRPLPAGMSRRSARWQSMLGEAATTDQVKTDEHARASGTTHAALVDGATLVDLDAYLTVWGTCPDTVTDARHQAALVTDRHRIRLDWLTGQQHRAHLMTTAHGAATRKGAIL